ncbi:hypothetical protein ACFLR5_00425, partial [Elusimicrobiota bacterium]
MKKLLFLFAIVASIGVMGVGAEFKISNVSNIFIAGGQHFLNNDPSTFGGNLSVYYSPVMNFSETNALVPVFNIDYRGTQDVEELVGGGTLTRQT